MFKKYLLPICCFYNFVFAGDISLSKSKNYNYIKIDGRFDYGISNKVKDAILYFSSINNNQTIVVFNSRGGYLSEGLKIGEMLKTYKVGAEVAPHKVCGSSCAYAFLGGTNKKNNKPLLFLHKDSNLGFHWFSYKNKELASIKTIQKDTLRLIQWLMKANLPSRTFHRILDTKYSSVYWVHSKRAIPFLKIID